MDKETAIEVLEDMQFMFQHNMDVVKQQIPAYMEVLDMAIEALKNRIEPKEADLISDVFQDLCCAGIKTLADGDDTAKSIFEKIGLIEREKPLCEK